MQLDDEYDLEVVHKMWLSAAHIPGKENTAVDKEARKINWDGEWKVEPKTLQAALKELDIYPQIDLFASRLNNQMELYVSFRPDPEALRWMLFRYHGKIYNSMLFHLSVLSRRC